MNDLYTTTKLLGFVLLMVAFIVKDKRTDLNFSSLASLCWAVEFFTKSCIDYLEGSYGWSGVYVVFGLIMLTLSRYAYMAAKNL